MCGHCRRRVARTTFDCWYNGSPLRTRHKAPPALPALWSLRWRLGALLGWDRPDAGLGSRVRTLRERLPADLRAAPGPEFDALPFKPLFLLDEEFAAEIANRTMHGVMHLGWVRDGKGGDRKSVV